MLKSVSTLGMGAGLGLLLAGCAGKTAAPVVVAVQPPPVSATAPMPDGASAGMMVPEPLADGSFPTPNRGLSADGAVWHLRAGLNVAALSCQGEQGAAIRAGYNRWLTKAKAPLAQAVKRYAAEYRVATPAGRAAYDEAMTKLYNFFSQTPVRGGFCTAAAAIVTDLPIGAKADLTGFAVPQLAALDRPFTDFYRAYDDWRDGRPAIRPVIAAAAVTPPGPVAVRSSTAQATKTKYVPHLVLDLSSLPADDQVASR